MNKCYLHGMSKTRLHKIWRDMYSRCYTESDYHYQWYGAKGIIIDNIWLGKPNGFINFKDWALNNGYKDDLTIDRINNDKPYSPDNCRWITTLEQCHNRGLFKTNKSGVSGVHYDKESGKWRAEITSNYKIYHLGRYETKEEAIKVRKQAEIKYWINKDTDKPKNQHNKSGIVGVCFDKSRNKWVAQLRINGKKYYIGRFDNMDDAAKAYEDAKTKYSNISEVVQNG